MRYSNANCTAKRFAKKTRAAKNVSFMTSQKTTIRIIIKLGEREREKKSIRSSMDMKCF